MHCCGRAFFQAPCDSCSFPISLLPLQASFLLLDLPSIQKTPADGSLDTTDIPVLVVQAVKLNRPAVSLVWASRTAELSVTKLGIALCLMPSTLSAANQKEAPCNQNKTPNQESNTAVGFVFLFS